MIFMHLFIFFTCYKISYLFQTQVIYQLIHQHTGMILSVYRAQPNNNFYNLSTFPIFQLIWRPWDFERLDLSIDPGSRFNVCVCVIQLHMQ